MLELIGQALLSCLEPVNILTMFISVTIGIVIGALPGFGAATGLVLVLPLTYSIDPSTAFIALTGIYLGAEYGGSISSILINTPGTTAAVITAFDGYPLAQRGHAREALLLSNVASFSGGCFGGFMMLLCMPILGKFVLKFGAGEIFILAAIGLLLVGSIARGNMLKGIASAGLGLFFTLFGADSINGVSRFDFDVPILIGGLPLIGGMLGMFAVPQMINLALSAHIRQEKVEFGDCTISANFSMFRKCVAAIYPKMLGIVARSGLFGVLSGYRGWDLAVSLAVIAAAAWFYGMARDYPETSRLFPQIVLLVIGGCMAINVVRCIFFGTLYAGIPAPFAGLNLKKAAVSVALLLGYLFCMNLLGFYASTALFFMAASFVLDLWQNPEIPVLRRLRGSLLYTVCAVPCLWLIFVKLFRVSMPEGILM